MGELALGTGVEMEPLGAGPSSKRRRSEEVTVGESPLWLMKDTEEANSRHTIHNQELPPRLDVGSEKQGGDNIDHISGLPDAILGDIISLLSRKEAARTQILSPRWRDIWKDTPLTIDSTIIAPKAIRYNESILASVVSRILSVYPGPVRRFSIPPCHLHDRAPIVDAWLCSPALDNLQELDFWNESTSEYHGEFVVVPPPTSAFRFSASLRVATFTKCQLLDSSIEGLSFPHLKQLAFDYVSISEASLQRMISSCPILECFLLNYCFGFSCVRISSSSLRSIGMGASRLGNEPHLREFIIVDAPCLERLLFLQQRMAVNVSVIAAPKLETLGCLCDEVDPFKLVFGTTIIKGLHVVRLNTAVRNVKILAVKSWHTNLDMVIDLMKCFPCLEKLYIKCCISRGTNRWRQKYRQFIQCFDIHLKTIVLQQYRGTKPQVNFASFFLLNARKLELMTLVIESTANNEAFFAEQYRALQMDRRASRTARLHFTTDHISPDVKINHVRDLATTKPFECRF